MKSILSIVIWASLACCAVEAGAEEPIALQKIQLDIVRQSLNDALNAWAEQTGFQLVCLAPEVARELVAPKMKGAFTAMAALEQLLSGTPLVYEFTSERTVTVRARFTAASQTTRSLDRVDVPRLQVAALSAADDGNERIAQNDPGRSKEMSAPTSRNTSPETHDVEELEEIVVTGTHIRGTAPIGSPLIVIDSAQIRSSGRGRAVEILEDLPQNFTSTSYDAFGDATSGNYTHATAVDLRGLGSSSTLVLVNGRRQPAGGTQGAFVDVSSIPVAAIDRIEVLTDGASALYGSDAIGGVVNFILKRNFDGFETGARIDSYAGSTNEIEVSQLVGHSWKQGGVLLGYQYRSRDLQMTADTPYGRFGRDYRHLGGDDLRGAGGTPGTVIDLGTSTSYAIPSGQNGTSVTVNDLLPGQNFQDYVTGISFAPEELQRSAFLSAHYAFESGLEVSIDGRYSNQDKRSTYTNPTDIFFVPASNAFNPFGNDALVWYSFGKEFGGLSNESIHVETYAMMLGGSAPLGQEWKLNLGLSNGVEKNLAENFSLIDYGAVDSALADTDPLTALNLFGDGTANNPATLQSIRRNSLDRGRSRMSSANVIADGPIFSVPAGAAKLAVGLDYRKERLEADFGVIAPAATGTYTPFAESVGTLDRRVKAAFAEFALPLLAHPRLELSLAGRYEDYSDFGTTANPKIGLSIAPSDAWHFRGTYGTSFRAPRFNELSTSAHPPIGLATEVPDPTSPNGTSLVLLIQRPNPNLDPETADFWTAGVDFTPQQLPGLSLSLTYFRVDYEDKIQIGGVFSDTLLHEDEWAEIITRSPSPEQISEVCNAPGFIGTCPSSVAAILDLSLRNLGSVRTSGVDLNLRLRQPFVGGALETALSGTYTTEYEVAASSTAQSNSVVDTVGNPLKLRARLIGSYGRGPWSVNTALNYTGSYADVARNRAVESFTSVDAGVSYTFAEDSPWLDGTSLQLNVANVLDKDPPFVNWPSGFDNMNHSQLGRSVSFRVTKRW